MGFWQVVRVIQSCCVHGICDKQRRCLVYVQRDRCQSQGRGGLAARRPDFTYRNCPSLFQWISVYVRSHFFLFSTPYEYGSMSSPDALDLTESQLEAGVETVSSPCLKDVTCDQQLSNCSESELER